MSFSIAKGYWETRKVVEYSHFKEEQFDIGGFGCRYSVSARFGTYLSIVQMDAVVLYKLRRAGTDFEVEGNSILVKKANKKLIMCLILLLFD
jgi:hypothetical protein